MPDLLHSLKGQDIVYLRIVAERWGVELKSQTWDGAAKELVASILDQQLFTELISSFSPEAKSALAALAAAGGRMPWPAFVRRFGDVREMGAGRRDREKPYLKPESPAEFLFYRGLLARAFFDTDKGAQEFAFMPEEILKFLRRNETRNATKENPQPTKAARSDENSEPLGRRATPAERAHIVPSTDRILDDATTLLAGLRAGHATQPDPFLQALLHAAGLLRKNVPRTEEIRSFLAAPRAEALSILAQAWQTSDAVNELRLIPGLACEGEWTNSPQATRNIVLSWLAAIPGNTWWGLNAFVSDIKSKRPDFQRPAGDYDSWFIKRQADGRYLRGFACWDEVDGALIRFFITSVLYRLGMLDLAGVHPEGESTAFRLAGIEGREAKGRISNSESRFTNIENGKLKISSSGMIYVPRLTPRAVRYQVARFGEPQQEQPEEYRYRLTPASLTKAKEQGLNVEQILTLLSRHAEAGIPPVLVKAVKRWEAEGTVARAETQVVLRVNKPEVLTELRKSGAGRFLGQTLGPTAVVIKPGAQAKVMSALAEMGLLAEDATAETSET